ncbi:MAG: thymidine phosphorylase, partial [Candidatus Diapherotrites archaeon]
LAEKSCDLAGLLLELSGKAKKGQGKKIATEILESGKALKKMKEIIKAQGGKVYASNEIKDAKYKAVIRASCESEISKINIKKCIKAARLAGAPADAKAGLMLHSEEGDTLKKDDIIFVIYASNPRKLELAKKYIIKDSPIESEGIILETIV